jgi:hypothetical protein
LTLAGGLDRFPAHHAGPAPGEPFLPTVFRAKVD